MKERFENKKGDKAPRPATIAGGPGWTPKHTVDFAQNSTDAGALLQTRNETICSDAVNCGYVHQIGMYAILYYSGEQRMKTEEEITKLFHRAVYRLDLVEAIKDIRCFRQNKGSETAHESYDQPYVHTDDFL